MGECKKLTNPGWTPYRVTNVLLSGNTIAVTLEWEGDSSEEGDAEVCQVQFSKEVSRLECARLLLLERGREALRKAEHLFPEDKKSL